MSTPSDPYGPPGDPSQQPGQGEQPPQYGQQPPQYGQQPGYGQPAYGAPQDSAGFGAPPPGWGQPQKSGTNGLAIASLVTAFLCSPIGIILGFVAKNQIKKTGQSGNGLATAGIVVGIALIVINILLISSGALNTTTTTP